MRRGRSYWKQLTFLGLKRFVGGSRSCLIWRYIDHFSCLSPANTYFSPRAEEFAFSALRVKQPMSDGGVKSGIYNKSGSIHLTLLIYNQAGVVLNLLVSLFHCFIAHSDRKRGNIQTDRQTDTDYGPNTVTLAALALRGLITVKITVWQ